MLVYEGVKKDFLFHVEEDSIAYKIEKKIFQNTNRHTSQSEFRSWENSMQYMYKVLNDSEIPQDAGIAIEYNIPQTSKRVDFLISGYDKKHMANVILIELKQWDKISLIESKDAIVETFTGGALRQVVHPSYQAWSYAMHITDYNEAVQQKYISIKPCAYLHNYRRQEFDPIDHPQYLEYTKDAPVFSRGQVSDLRTFIKKCIVTGDSDRLIYQIDSARIKPSKRLQDTLKTLLAGNQEFYLLDDQKVIFEEIIQTSLQAQKENKKQVIIIEGGPGTGKTVVAINALAQLTQYEQFVQYVSKNSAPRQVYAQKLKGSYRKSSIDNMFKGSGIYTDASENIVDTILIDEAHRLNEKSGMFQNLGENQIKELIHASKCSVFFIDENQRVTLKDIGKIDEITKWANHYQADITKLELTSQFRCDGSDGYLAWLDNVLEIRDTANFSLEDIDYDIQIMDTPMAMKDKIFSLNNQGKQSRILAGYCWNWDKSGRNDSTHYDIEIDDFKMSWNLDNSSPYAIDDSSINEVGCIHTTQGLEFDYVGVIIGNDMRYENQQIVTDFTARAKTDQSLKGIKSLYKQDPDLAIKEADEIIKNTYRTLLTRGMKGCYIYCVDSNLQEYLKERLGNGQRNISTY